MNIFDDLYDGLCSISDAVIKKCALAWLSLLLIHAADDKRGMARLVWQMWRMSDSDLLWLAVELESSLAGIRAERARRR